MEQRPEIDCIEANLHLAKTTEGGKHNAVTTGYRGGLIVFPEWFDTWDDEGEARCLGAVLRLCDVDELCPGESATVRFYPWADGAMGIADISPGVSFRVHEGRRLIGSGTVLRTLRERWPE